MKQLQSLRKIGLLILALPGVYLSVGLFDSSAALIINDQGITEQEQQTPDIPNVERSPEQEFCDTTPEDMTLAIPLGTNDPFTDVQSQNDDGETLNAINLEAVGTLNPSGQPEPITARDICEMFKASISLGCSLENFHQRQVQTMVSSLYPIDISPLIQARRIAVIDLVVRNKDNSKYYLVPNVRVDSFCRDALNSVHNDTFRQYDGNLSRLLENNND